MPQGRIATSWLREKIEAKSRLISPYILRGSPFFPASKHRLGRTQNRRGSFRQERGYGCRPLATVRGTDRIRHIRKGVWEEGEGAKENKLAGVNHLRNFVPTETSVGKTTAAGALGTWERFVAPPLREGARQAGAAIRLSSRGISVLRMAGSASPHCHPKKGKIFQTENASCVQQKSRSHQVKTQTRLSPRAACRFSTSLGIFNDLGGSTLISYLACSNGFLIIISRLVLKISGKGQHYPVEYSTLHANLTIIFKIHTHTHTQYFCCKQDIAIRTKYFSGCFSPRVSLSLRNN